MAFVGSLHFPICRIKTSQCYYWPVTFQALTGNPWQLLHGSGISGNKTVGRFTTQTHQLYFRHQHLRFYQNRSIWINISGVTSDGSYVHAWYVYNFMTILFLLQLTRIGNNTISSSQAEASWSKEALLTLLSVLFMIIFSVIGLIARRRIFDAIMRCTRRGLIGTLNMNKI